MQSSSSSPLASPLPAGQRDTKFRHSSTNRITSHSVCVFTEMKETLKKLFFSPQLLLLQSVSLVSRSPDSHLMCSLLSHCVLNTCHGYDGPNTSHDWVPAAVFTLASEVTVTSRILYSHSLSSSWLLAATSSNGPARIEAFGTREKT